MSKTKGNVIDPIEIVKQYGTDAVRFTLASQASPGTDIAFSEARTEGYRAFANKIWNAARFLFMQRERLFPEGGFVADSIDLATVSHDQAVLLPDPANPEAPKHTESANQSRLEDRWILSRLYATANAVNSALEAYRFDEAAHAIYQFFWGDLCDWYLELVKLRIESSDSNQSDDDQDGLLAFLLFNGVFDSSLRLLSPFMPFITEEIWHAFHAGRPPGADSIALMPYPVAAKKDLDEESEAQMALLQSLIVAVRAARKDAGVPERESIPILVRTADAPSSSRTSPPSSASRASLRWKSFRNCPKALPTAPRLPSMSASSTKRPLTPRRNANVSLKNSQSWKKKKRTATANSRTRHSWPKRPRRSSKASAAATRSWPRSLSARVLRSMPCRPPSGRSYRTAACRVHSASRPSRMKSFC